MTNEPRHSAAATLGDVLYSNSSRPLIPETDWLSLVQSIGAGDQLALHDLYARTHRAVFTLIMRITSNRKMAEELMLAVFHDVWRRASHYDPASGTVLAWVMNQARSYAIDRLRLEQRNKRIDANPDARLLAIDTAEYGDLLEVKEQSRAIRSVLSVLTSHELAVGSACRSRQAANSLRIAQAEPGSGRGERSHECAFAGERLRAGRAHERVRPARSFAW
jgi:RNA polymerase sigma factor (sigma-70 family)